MPSAAAALAAIVRDIKEDQLDAPTPCSEYDVRALIGHLLQWGPVLEGAGRKESVPPKSEVDYASWRADLLSQLDRTTAAWSSPAAWTGTTVMGSPDEMPASVIGDMVVGELVVHGWDLAVATGQVLDVPEDLVTHVHGVVAESAPQGREMGLYGPEVPVPPTAPTMARLLALTGRDPQWQADLAHQPS